MNIFDTIASSNQRRLLLSLLHESPKTLKEIVELTGLSSPLISRQLRKLLEIGLVEKDGTSYIMTEKGEIVYLAIKKFSDIVSTIERDPQFWEIHDLSRIPTEFKLRIDELGEYTVLRSEGDEVLKHFRVFSEIYRTSNIVRVVSAVFFPSHPQMFAEISKKSDVEVILTENAIHTLENDYKKELESYLSHGGRMFINNNIWFTVITTEKALCMGLFLRDGKYDTESGFLSYDESARKWGFDLFEYFKRRSKEYP